MRVLLLSDIPPCSNYTAGIVLEQLCAFLPAGSVACFGAIHKTIRPGATSVIPPSQMRIEPRPRDGWHVLPGRLGDAVSLVMEPLSACTDVRRLARHAVKFGRSFGADRVWCTLEGQTLIRLAVPVADALDVPLYTQIWDPPGWWLRENRIDPVNRRVILRRFSRALQRSSAIAAISPAMAEEYAQKWDVTAIPVIPGVPAEYALPPADRPGGGAEVTIGLAGQLYASQEWNALMLALDAAGWRLGGKPVRVVLLGRHAGLSSETPRSVHYLGWRSQRETIDALSKADVLYCPYWFDPAFAEEARLCFPSKLSTYFAAGRPVFFHGPEYAYPARFLREHEAGAVCNSLEPTPIIRQLEDVVRDTSTYVTYAQNGRKAFDQLLTTEVMRRSFLRFLGAEDAHV